MGFFTDLLNKLKQKQAVRDTVDYFGIGQKGSGQFGQQVSRTYRPIANELRQVPSNVKSNIFRPVASSVRKQITNPNSGFNKLSDLATQSNEKFYGGIARGGMNIASAVAPKYRTQIQNFSKIAAPDTEARTKWGKAGDTMGKYQKGITEFVGTLPIGIGKVARLEKMSALPKFLGYTGVRTGEGAVYGALAGASETGTREGARQGAKQGAKFSVLANTLLSPKATYQASRQLFRIPVSKAADAMMQPVASAMGAMPSKGKKVADALSNEANYQPAKILRSESVYNDKFIQGTYKGKPYTSNAYILEFSGNVKPSKKATIFTGDKAPNEQAIESIIPKGDLRKAELTKALSTDMGERVVLNNGKADSIVQRQYYDYFKKKYPNAEFSFVEPELPILVTQNGEKVGLIMPVKGGVDEIQNAKPIWEKPAQTISQNDIVRKATEARKARLERDGFVDPVTNSLSPQSNTPLSNEAEKFDIELARQNVSNLTGKTNLKDFAKQSKGNLHNFAYVDDLSPSVANKYKSPVKSVISEKQIDHLRKRPKYYDEVIDLLPEAVRNPDSDLLNPKRANSFIVMKQGTKNFGVILEVDRIGDYNFIRTVEPIPNRTLRSYLKQVGRPAIPPSLPESETLVRQSSRNIISDLQSTDAMVPPKPSNVNPTEGANFLDDVQRESDRMLNAPARKNNVTVEYPEASMADEALGKSDTLKGNYKNILDNWVNSRNVARTVGAKKTLDTNIPYREAKETIKALEGSANPTQTSQIFRNEFDSAYKAAQDAGLDVGYIDDYLTHIWKESPQAVKEKFASASKSFKFAKDRTIPTYEEGIKLGLTPKYDTPQQILGHYTQKLEEVKANIKFFNDLKDQGFIVPASVGANNPSFKAITGAGFPKSTSIVGKGEKVIGAWYAPREIVDDINKVFGINESPKALSVAANVSGKVQDILLSGGIPKTPVNAFTFAQITKEILGGNFRSPLKSFVTSLSEGATRKFFSRNVDQIIKMQKNGIDLRSGFSIEDLADRGTIKNVFGNNLGEAWDKVVSDPTFKRFMPSLQINMFNAVERGALKGGKSADEAAKIAAMAVKNFYGLKSATGEVLQSQVSKDLLKTFAFAPKYRESMINFWINNVKAWKAPLAKENRSNVIFALGAIATYVAMDTANVAINGNHMKDNPTGKVDKLLIPLGNGKTIGIPYLSSIATVPRSLWRGGKALIQGDIKGAGNELLKSNLSAGLKPLAEVAANENYFGEEIYDDYDTSGEKWKKIANYLLNPVTGAYGHPYIREGIKYAQGKQGGLETISKATESPIRWYKTSSIENAGFWEANDIQKQITEVEKQAKYGKIPTETAQKRVQGLKTKQGKLLNKSNVAKAETGSDSRIRDLGGYFGITTSKGTDFADTYEEAQKELAKDDFSKTNANFKDMGDYVLRKSSDGDVTAQPKIQYEADLMEAKKTRFKKNKDLKGWMANAESLADNYENQLKDSTLDELEKLKIQGKLDDLIAEAQKYASYGGFTKGKKPIMPDASRVIRLSAPQAQAKSSGVTVAKIKMPNLSTSMPKISVGGFNARAARRPKARIRIAR
jgi:hypothetical protein